MDFKLPTYLTSEIRLRNLSESSRSIRKTQIKSAGLERQNTWVRVPIMSKAFILPRILHTFFRMKKYAAGGYLDGLLQQ